MASTFSMLRANDLIWSFFINNYLLGKDPFPFDLLYWNSDSTRMPAKMHSFYLRNMYQNNRLKDAGRISLLDTPIDLTQVKVPTYFLSAIEDHISPWASNYMPVPVVQWTSQVRPERFRTHSPARSTRHRPTSTSTGPTPSTPPMRKSG
jgi:poly(3-hydroxyalkanoate) synthetase